MSLTREYDPASKDLHNQAFNEGCDARLAGQSALACPYTGQQLQYRAWLEGWWDVHDHWGEKNQAAREQLQPVRSEA